MWSLVDERSDGLQPPSLSSSFDFWYAAILLVSPAGSMQHGQHCYRYPEHVYRCSWALRRPAAAFAVSCFRFLHCCNPTGQFHRLPVASAGFGFSEKKVDVDLPLVVETLPGKFRCIRFNGVGMHSEQTDRQTFFLIYIEDGRLCSQEENAQVTSVNALRSYWSKIAASPRKKVNERWWKILAAADHSTSGRFISKQENVTDLSYAVDARTEVESATWSLHSARRSHRWSIGSTIAHESRYLSHRLVTVCGICRHRQTISSSPSLPAQVRIIVWSWHLQCQQFKNVIDRDGVSLLYFANRFHRWISYHCLEGQIERHGRRGRWFHAFASSTSVGEDTLIVRRKSRETRGACSYGC